MDHAELLLNDGRTMTVLLAHGQLGQLLAGPRAGRVGLHDESTGEWRWVDLAEVARVRVLSGAGV